MRQSVFRSVVCALLEAHDIVLLSYGCTDGSVVEFSPATREARVRFPASAKFCSQSEGIIAVEF